ncbi:MAG: mercury methylation corrinoid protein HgcA [Clostridiaceae bacterium]
MANTCCGGSKVTIRRSKQSSCCGGTRSGADSAPCCGQQDAEESEVVVEKAIDESRFESRWVTGRVSTPVGDVPQVATKLSFQDTLGSWKCRWSIGRMNYTVDPGLYAVGTPTADSPVLVTSNYKMTFDRLREQLGQQNLWIMVLDTDGVNVWCAAGKGTFGTDEVIHRISEVNLSRVVSHRRLILPQLGAVGVAAHEVLKSSGFHVLYGPVRAKDIPQFLANGMQCTEEMRTVKFPIGDRAVLTPMELVGATVPLLVAFGVLFLFNAVGLGHYGWIDLYGILGAVFLGAIAAPILLPWIPGRAFSFKGAILGVLWAVGFLFINGLPGTPVFGWLKASAYLLLLPALSGFLTMNFTGSSTFTSLSGVDREMKIAIPMMLFAAVGAVLLLLASDLTLLLGGVPV